MKRKREELRALTAAARQVDCPALDLDIDDIQDFFDVVCTPVLNEQAKKGKTAGTVAILQFEVIEREAPTNLFDVDMLVKKPFMIAGSTKGHSCANALAGWFNEMLRYESSVMYGQPDDIVKSYCRAKTNAIWSVLRTLGTELDGLPFVTVKKSAYCGNGLNEFIVTLRLQFSWESDEAVAHSAKCRKKLRAAEQELQDALSQF